MIHARKRKTHVKPYNLSKNDFDPPAPEKKKKNASDYSSEQRARRAP
jgi:hypothetical protein